MSPEELRVRPYQGLFVATTCGTTIAGAMTFLAGGNIGSGGGIRSANKGVNEGFTFEGNTAFNCFNVGNDFAIGKNLSGISNFSKQRSEMPV